MQTAPALWAILSSQVLWDLTIQGPSPTQLPLTLFADDHLGHRILRSVADVKQMEQLMIRLFRLLASYGLKVNPDKSSVIIRVQGTQLKKFVKARTVMIKQKPHWKLQDGDTEHLILLFVPRRLNT